MNENPHNPPRRRWREELADLERRVTERGAENERRLAADWSDPRVQRGIRAFAGHLIAERHAERLSGASVAQLEQLQQRLERLGLLDLNADPDGMVELGSVNDLATGEITSAIATHGRFYWERGHDLVAQELRCDGIWETRIDDDTGEPIEPWSLVAPPPPSHASQN